MKPLRLILFLALTTAASAQAPSLPTPEEANMQFEVASIRPTKPDAQGGGIKATTGGDGYTAAGVPVKLMIALMYRIPMRQIKGAPDWVEKDRYDIDAKADKKYNIDDLHAMYQNMLIDRFKLKYHLETKEANAYVLTVDKSGLKMTPNNKPQDFEIPWIPQGFGVVRGTRVPVPYLCWNLGQILQDDERPVVDQTGLKGFYDFTLTFLPNNAEQFRDRLPAEVFDRPTIFAALPAQLGLKLTAQKGPVTYFVIDHIERPTEN
jgi:uncharacterized protein (TIGR03435 family)